MIEQLKTIREFFKRPVPHSPQDLGEYLAEKSKAVQAAAQLEAMVGSQEPVAWAVYWGLPPTRQNSVHFDKESAQAVANQIKSATEVRPLYAAPVAQQPQARPDFTDEWAGYLKDGETPFERFLRERKDVQSALKLYQRALEENERLKAQQPQAEAVPITSETGNAPDQGASAITSESGKAGQVLTDRHTLQAQGKHPAPCARFCEANALRAEARELTRLAQPITSLTITERARLLTAADHLDGDGHFMDCADAEWAAQWLRRLLPNTP